MGSRMGGQQCRVYERITGGELFLAELSQYSLSLIALTALP